jgi:3-oxoacyl-[acyl-carrier-protein] synthase-3
MNLRAAIGPIAVYLPGGQLTNDDLAREFCEWDAEKIFRKTGIVTRRIASREECASDLGVAAAQRLFENGEIGRSDIDFLLFCTQSPDYFLPATACSMQSRLGLSTSCGALDFNQGCSGFVYGLSLAKGLIESGNASTVLLVTAETYSKFLSSGDRGTRTLFGDGAAATIVRAVKGDEEPIGPFVFGTDGRGAGHLMVRDGGMRYPGKPGTLSMDGPEIFNFTIRAVPGAVRSLLEKAGLSITEVDYFVFHQANRFMLEHLRDKLSINSERFCINLESYGNTVSSTIPMALDLSIQSKHVGPGSRVMLVGFGVGLSWAACLVRLGG